MLHSAHSVRAGATRLRPPPFQLPSGLALCGLAIARDVLELVPRSVAEECCVLPVAFNGETLTCVTPRADDVMTQDKLRFILNCDVYFIPRDAHEVRRAIGHHYRALPAESADSMLQEFTDTAIDFTETVDTVAWDDDCMMGEWAPPEPWQRSSARVQSSVAIVPPNAQGETMMFMTIAEGERMLAYRPNGKIDVLQGPRRIWKGMTQFARMQHFVAHPAQYLSIRFRDGREDTVVGPAEVWLDPRIHESIEVRHCLELAAKEAVVVYGAGEGAETSRRIVHGPALFAPRPGEWLHHFSWHASHGGSRGAEKRPNALKFEKLCMMPDQMYHDVRDVRTADDAVLTVRLMIFFELVDIDRMLDTTHDPIGDFINAATSDVVEFTGKRSFEEFKQQTELLNEIATYSQLLHRASQCGYKINNVVYRGYGAPDSLQTMHDEAIQTRTRLQLERATEEQAQQVEDYRLSCQMERAAKRREEQMTEVQHDLELKRQQAEAQLEQRRRRAGAAREERRAHEELALELMQRRNEQQQAHLESLRALQVDLTEFLTQGRADQVIELRGDARVRPDVHLGNGKGASAAPRRRS